MRKTIKALKREWQEMDHIDGDISKPMVLMDKVGYEPADAFPENATKIEFNGTDYL